MSEIHKPTAAEMLARIDSRLIVIESKIDTLSDHEDRIRALERHRYQSAWMISMLSAVATASLVAIIVKAIG